MKAIFQEIIVSILALVFALLVGAIVILAIGKDPLKAYELLLDGSLGNEYGVGQVIFKATTLIIAGIAVALSFRTGIFNIGADGQIYAGAFGCAVVGFWLPEGTPAVVAIILCTIAAFICGGLAAAVPAALKSFRGIHEVITTIMMNFILFACINFVIGKYLAQEKTVHTRAIVPAARIPSFGESFGFCEGALSNHTFFVAIALSILFAYVLFRTRFGYEMRATGLNPSAAECAGIKVKLLSFLTLCLSGAVAGVCGINFVLGQYGYLEKNATEKQGYIAIAVALLGRNHPFGIIPAAFLFAILSEGAPVMQEEAPREIVDMLLGIIILCTVVGSILIQWYLRNLEKARIKQNV